MILGLIAGYFGRWVYAVIMRIMDALMAFPMILFALVIASLLGGGLRNVMIALGYRPGAGICQADVRAGPYPSRKMTISWPSAAIGASNMRIMLRHIFPNCMPPLIVMITMMMGMTMLAEAGLSYLGIGIEAAAGSLGRHD